MELLIKSIRQEVSFDDSGDITNVLILQETQTGEQFLAVVSDAAVTRLVEIKQGLPPRQSTSSTVSVVTETDFHSVSGEPSYDDGPVVFGGAAAEPMTALEEAYAPTLPPEAPPNPSGVAVAAMTVEEQLRAKKTKRPVNLNAVYNGGPTVAKDDLGYPIVPHLKRAPVVHDGDEDGIGQA